MDQKESDLSATKDRLVNLMENLKDVKDFQANNQDWQLRKFEEQVIQNNTLKAENESLRATITKSAESESETKSELKSRLVKVESELRRIHKENKALKQQVSDLQPLSLTQSPNEKPISQPRHSSHIREPEEVLMGLTPSRPFDANDLDLPHHHRPLRGRGENREVHPGLGAQYQSLVGYEDAEPVRRLHGISFPREDLYHPGPNKDGTGSSIPFRERIHPTGRVFSGPSMRGEEQYSPEYYQHFPLK